MVKKSFYHFNRLPPTGWIGLFTFTVATTFLIRHQEPFYTWFYCFAWWSYILVIDAMNRVLEGESLLIDYPADFAFLAFASVGVWLIFEMFNIVLSNWHYVQLPANRPLRWAGYFIAYATVLPGLFETASFLKCIGVLKRWEHGRLFITPGHWRLWFFITGLFFLLVPVIWPGYFFPLVWLGFFFLLEPVNYTCGGYSFIKLGEVGAWRELGLLLMAGGVCGFLWELWNFWARSKWIYTVPWIGNWKLFEMPILGFLGFPPFAVESYVIMSTIFLVRDHFSGEKKGKKSPAQISRVIICVSLVLVFLLIYAFAFALIDKYTVIAFRK